MAEQQTASATRAQPILVTGTPRGGTTLVGTILCKAPGLAYVYEPFNINQAMGTCKSPFPGWFSYVCDRNAAKFKPGLDRSLSFRYNLLHQVFGARRAKDIARLPTDFKWFMKGRLTGCRPVMKDPIAIFSSEWLAKTYDMKVVVLIRHPGGFVSSRKSRMETHDFSHFLIQPELIEEILHPFRDEIQAQVDNPGSYVEQGALIWKLVFHAVAEFQDRHPDWLFLKLEDLSSEPVEAFRRVFEYTDTPFTDEIEATVLEYTSAKNPKEARKFGNFSARTLKRSSKASASSWKKRLTPDEIATVRRIVGDLPDRWYDPAGWD